jgi:hypothetical protein
MKEAKTWNNFVQSNPRLNLKIFFERRGILSAEQVISYCVDKRILPPAVEQIQHMFAEGVEESDSLVLEEKEETSSEPQDAEKEVEADAETVDEEKTVENRDRPKNKPHNKEDKAERQQKRQNDR